MALKANYFKLGLFVLGGLVSLVAVLVIIGSGRAFQQKITIETYFNESVQGLDIGSKVKYRGVVIGEVTKITFTYTKYQLDRQMTDRDRYVLVEAQLQPKLLGGRQAAEITGPDSAIVEAARGLRVRSSPQGITGTNYLEIDYVDPPPPVLHIDWTPDNVYIPSAPSTVTALVNAASDIMERLHKMDIEGVITNFNRLLVTTNEKVTALDAQGLSASTNRVLAKVDKSLDDLAAKRLSDDASALLVELRQSNAELKKILTDPNMKKFPEDAAAAMASLRSLAADPKLARSISDLQQSVARLNRILGTGEGDLATTFQNLHQITDNLRELTEDTKRYPANLFFGAPPPPLERKP